MRYILFPVTLVTLLMLTACNGYKYQDDNIVEEGVELALKAATGVDIDLSASTPETGFSPKALSPVIKTTP